MIPHWAFLWVDTLFVVVALTGALKPKKSELLDLLAVPVPVVVAALFIAGNKPFFVVADDALLVEGFKLKKSEVDLVGLTVENDDSALRLLHAVMSGTSYKFAEPKLPSNQEEVILALGALNIEMLLVHDVLA